MKRCLVFLACMGAIVFSSAAQGQVTTKVDVKSETKVDIGTGVACIDGAVKTSSDTKYVPVEKYDPLRNADLDIQNALAEAKRTNRRVLLEVGGLWCVWCRHMDDFFAKQSDILAFREKYFVTLKVNYSDENKNEVVLARYPKIVGYPHIFVLDNDGKLLHSQDTGELEEGKGYNKNKFAEFLKKWADGSADLAGK